MADRQWNHPTTTPRPCASRPAGAYASAVQLCRSGSTAWLDIAGELNQLTSRHLDDWLDWLISTDASHVTVTLASADQLDAGCVRVLQVARARLAARHGQLVVIVSPAPEPELPFDAAWARLAEARPRRVRGDALVPGRAAQ